MPSASPLQSALECLRFFRELPIQAALDFFSSNLVNKPNTVKSTRSTVDKLLMPEIRARYSLSTPPDPAVSTRERLLESAIHILHQQGFAALTQQRVAEAAGLRQSNLTYHFPKRSDLLKAVAEYGRDMIVSQVRDTQSDATGSHDTSVEALGEKLLRYLLRDRGMPRLLLALIVASDTEPDLKPWLASMQTHMTTQMLQILHAHGVEASIDATTLFHRTIVGTAIIDLAVSTPESAADKQRIAQQAFEQLVATAKR